LHKLGRADDALPVWTTSSSGTGAPVVLKLIPTLKQAWRSLRRRGSPAKMPVASPTPKTISAGASTVGGDEIPNQLES
jgi:hypothetical protein